MRYAAKRTAAVRGTVLAPPIRLRSRRALGASLLRGLLPVLLAAAGFGLLAVAWGPAAEPVSAGVVRPLHDAHQDARGEAAHGPDHAGPSAGPLAGAALGTGACGEPLDAWHPPVIDGCATGHEHGDAPPAWLIDAGYAVSFSGHFNTSERENTAKHAAMKAFLARFGDTDIYFRVHAASNVLDRSARFHSYEVWARDPAGAVSHWQGWYDSGDPRADRIPRTQGDPGRRPVILAVDRASWEAGIKCEQWYATTASWSWDFGWTICGINALYYPGENDEPDQASWRSPPDGPGTGGVRRLEAAWYGAAMPGREHPTGQFWATQFGEIVPTPDDPRCAGSTVRFGTTYANVCLEQFIAPTAQAVRYPGNALQKTFDTEGVRAPN